MSRHLRQGDPRWRHLQLGLGKSTIGAAGCLLVATCEALTQLGVNGPTRPDDVNTLARTRGAFAAGRSGSPPAKLARAVGLVVDDRRVRAAPTHTTLQMRDVILEALAAGGRVIAWVDHDSNKANGDAEGDHFVLIARVAEDDVIYIDPTTGEPDRLMSRTLTGVATWRKPQTRGPTDPGDVRVYTVRAVWPVYAPGTPLPSSMSPEAE
jgi:hypothetical protein